MMFMSWVDMRLEVLEDESRAPETQLLLNKKM